MSDSVHRSIILTRSQFNQLRSDLVTAAAAVINLATRLPISDPYFADLIGLSERLTLASSALVNQATYSGD